MELELRNLKEKDLEDYEYWNQPCREFHKWNGPYYPKLSSEELKLSINKLREQLKNNNEIELPNKKIISNKENDEIIGEVNYYWKSQETNWLEVGIVIFNENYWGKSLGEKALRMWINEIFEKFPQIVRIGLSTWSGNKRMVALRQKLGLKKEADYKNARIVDGKYYDSLSFGILKADWLK